jgi:hypothetical protein
MKATSLIRDTCIALGACLVIGGTWWIYAPLGAIVGGACLAGFAILWEFEAARRKAEQERNRRAGL